MSEDNEYPYTACNICKVARSMEKVFKSLENGKYICIYCLKKYDLMYILDRDLYINYMKQVYNMDFQTLIQTGSIHEFDTEENINE